MNRTSDIDFIICYEHINREVENITLLKHELVRRGYSCESMHFGGPGLYKNSKKAKVVVTPWLRYNENVFHYIQLARKPYKLVNLQWEQVYSDQGIKSGLVDIKGEALKAVHLCWGENSRNRLIKSGSDREKTIIVGAIQQDFGRNIFKHYYFSRDDIAKQFHLDSKKNWILYVSSFAMANYDSQALNSLRERFGDYIIDNHNLHKKSQDATLAWIKQFLDDYDCEFIYRPHPSESMCEGLSNLELHYSNFHVISDYSVKQWATVSDHVNLWISTSNAEIASLGIPYNIVRPLRVPDEYEVESMKNQKKIDNFQDFLLANEKQIDSYRPKEQQIEELSYYYNFNLNKAAYIRTADILEKIHHNSSYSSEYSFSLAEHIIYGMKELKLKVLSYVMEAEMSNNNSLLLKSMPLTSVIKGNIKRRIKYCLEAESVELRMESFLEDNE